MSPNPAFFLDVDGTLLELADKPDSVTVPAELIEALSRLHRANGGAVALISGRSIKDLDRLFIPLRLPAAGQHGLERRDQQGRMHYHNELDKRFEQIRARLQAFARSTPGVLLEDKGFSLAIHYRECPDREDEVKGFLRQLVAGVETEFHLLKGKMVFEIKPDGRNKGMAITEFMEEPPFRHRVPVFLGDDVTDEDGFAVVNNMGGCSIKVGDGETAASRRFADPARVLDYLSTCAATLIRQQRHHNEFE